MTLAQYQLYSQLKEAGKIGRIWPEGNIVKVAPIFETERILGPSCYSSSREMSWEKFYLLLYQLDNKIIQSSDCDLIEPKPMGIETLTELARLTSGQRKLRWNDRFFERKVG